MGEFFDEVEGGIVEVGFAAVGAVGFLMRRPV